MPPGTKHPHHPPPTPNQEAQLKHANLAPKCIFNQQLYAFYDTTCKTTKFMEIYLSGKGFASKINNLTDFLFNKTEVKYQKIIMLSKKSSRTFPLFFSFPGLFFQDSTGFQDFPGLSRTFQDQWPPWLYIQFSTVWKLLNLEIFYTLFPLYLYLNT